MLNELRCSRCGATFTLSAKSKARRDVCPTCSHKERGKKAQRDGNDWEKNINDTNMRYAQQGLADIDWVPTRTAFKRGRMAYIRKSGTDFIGSARICGVVLPVRFDAKSFANRWDFGYYRPGESKHHQYLALERCAKLGGLAFILLRHTGQMVEGKAHMYGYQTWVLELSELRMLLNEGVNSVTPDVLDVRGTSTNGSDWMGAWR